MRIFLYSFAAFVVITITYACSKSSLVGADLFIPDSIELSFRDDFDIKAFTNNVDSVVTYDGAASITSLMVGQLRDPYFGETTAEAYANVSLLTQLGGTVIPPDFRFIKDGLETKVRLDSVVLVMEYNQAGFYGDSTTTHNIEVRVMENALPSGNKIFSTFRPSATDLIGSRSFVPSPRDSFIVIEPNDTIKVSNQFRMKLDNSWAQAMIDDTLLVHTPEAFLDYTPGISIKSTPNNSSTIGFNFNTLSSGAAPNNNIYIYYREDTLRKNYRFPLRGVRHNYYNHDTENAIVEEFLDDDEKGDSLVFLQGMAGPVVELELPVLSTDQLDGFLINRMELEFYVLESASQDIHAPIESIVLEEYNEEGDLVPIEDAIVAFNLGIPSYFEGTLEDVQLNGMTIKKYNAIISLHAIQELGSSNPKTRLRIVPRNKVTMPGRSIIFGPGHSEFPMRLKANFSK
ncbi:DUF4270 family protein [Portibacter marinus]|uniref:DUF4270 family protein n=1 Tax=Portibacter marinus TaxID=2898660 RepID=UPI001F2B380D|nr:DUF4270 family protein [Portibacter marinus]